MIQGMRRPLLLALAFGVAGAAPASAASPYAPLNRPGPELTVSKTSLKASLKCTPGVRHAEREPVLLLPATGFNSAQNFPWNYERAFRARKIPYGTADQPGKR